MTNDKQHMCGYELAKQCNLPAARPDEATAASVLGIITGSLLLLVSLQFAILLSATSDKPPQASRYADPDSALGWLMVAAFILGVTSLAGGIGFLSGNRHKLLLTSSLATGIASVFIVLWRWGLVRQEIRHSRAQDYEVLTTASNIAASSLLPGFVTMIFGFVTTWLLLKPASEHWQTG